MTTELAMVAAGALLSLALALATVAVHFRAFGGSTIRGNREGYPPLSGLPGRVVRAHAGLNEALLPFAAIVLVAAAAGVATRVTAAAAVAFVAARMVHAVCYLAGWTPWRSVAFYAGLAATLVLAAQLPLPI